MCQPQAFEGEKLSEPQSTFQNAWVPRAAAFFWWVFWQSFIGRAAMPRSPARSSHARNLAAAAQDARGIPHQRCSNTRCVGGSQQQIRDLTWTEICTELRYFPPTLHQHRDDRDQTQASPDTGSLAIGTSSGTDPAPTPTRSCQPARPGGRGEGRGPTHGQERVREVLREDNEWRAELGTNHHASGHSAPRTLECAKRRSNAVIWTKNIGHSFLRHFFSFKYCGYLFRSCGWPEREFAPIKVYMFWFSIWLVSIHVMVAC